MLRTLLSLVPGLPNEGLGAKVISTWIPQLLSPL